MRIMNAHSARALPAVLVHHVRACLGAHGPNLATSVVQTATASIADTATERGLENVGFEVPSSSWRSSLGVMPRDERQ